ncbi:zinc-binding dehydrogenase [Streptomyces marianii]|uniref:2-deoxy-scyllo-inosamine dehydrogenase n=1 Tax=Streptomyces marianii TaxID=1817406 RepID=A0A5R9ED70_9ACTN|nr:zinc-binding dehydrogenase [Streptomyces marianii]TLQ46965.1 zinc-binding dehydrogenase [Streptomyces marianii]
MDTMLAGRLNLATGSFAVTGVPVPEPGPGELLIEVKAAGVCLSDVHLIDRTLRPVFNPNNEVTLGHEVAGIVFRLGSNLKRPWKPGARVVLLGGEPCGTCDACWRHAPCLVPRTRGADFDGGWAQYAVAREECVYAIPDHLPFEQAAIIPDAVSTPYAAVVATAGVRPAQAVGIWGAGGLGVHAISVARLVGAEPIIAIDPLTDALERTLSYGADVALQPEDPNFHEKLMEATRGQGLDVAFDFAGVPTAREQAATSLARNGVLVLVGIAAQPFAIADDAVFNYSGNEVRGHYGSTPAHLEELIRLTSAGRLDLTASVSERLPLSQASEAVAHLAHKSGSPVRIVLTPAHRAGA